MLLWCFTSNKIDNKCILNIKVLLCVIWLRYPIVCLCLPDKKIKVTTKRLQFASPDKNVCIPTYHTRPQLLCRNRCPRVFHCSSRPLCCRQCRYRFHCPAFQSYSARRFRMMCFEEVHLLVSRWCKNYWDWLSLNTSGLLLCRVEQKLSRRK